MKISKGNSQEALDEGDDGGEHDGDGDGGEGRGGEGLPDHCEGRDWPEGDHGHSFLSQEEQEGGEGGGEGGEGRGGGGEGDGEVAEHKVDEEEGPAKRGRDHCVNLE